MIDAENLGIYEQELQIELAEFQESYKHYCEQLEIARQDKQSLSKFNYGENDLFTMEQKNGKLDEEIELLKKEIIKLEQLQGTFRESFSDIENQKVAIDKQLENTTNRIRKVEEFIEENQIYLANEGKLRETMDTITRLANEKKTLQDEMIAHTDVREKGLERKSELKYDLDDKKIKHSFVEGAQVAVILDEEVSLMQAKLDALRSEIKADLNRLKSNLENYEKEKGDRKRDLVGLMVEEELYIHVNFSESQLQGFRDRRGSLEKKRKDSDKKHRDLENANSTVKALMKAAEKEVKKLADTPLDASLIKPNFDERREEQRKGINTANKLWVQFNKQMSEYKEVTMKIEVNDISLEDATGLEYSITKGAGQDFAEQMEKLTILREENKRLKNNIHTGYLSLRSKYMSKNLNLSNLIEGLKSRSEKAQHYKDYYFIYERMTQNKGQLISLIKASEQRLQNLEKNKNDLVQHSYLQAKQVFEEIQKISENSAVKLDSKNQRMLRINMEALHDNEEENVLKIRDYIESSIMMVKEGMEAGWEQEETRRKISKAITSKELLNTLSDLGKMSIQAYKIDHNPKNSGYKSWDQVMKENSGGERFVSFFAVLIALMSYTRASMKYEDDYQRNQDTKVLIMDNPFGPISSEHLLKPLFEIAKRYNTQLICFTDLKQNSIMNCFNLIYMIKIRPNVFGTTEYIQLEAQLKEGIDGEVDQRLEKALFRVEEQAGLF